MEEHFHSAEDWESQLRALKAKSREADKLPRELRFGCIRLDTTSIRAAVEDMLKRVYSSLVYTLRHSISSELQTIDQQISEAVEKLSRLPQSLDEVSEANADQLAFMKINKQASRSRKLQ